jgi:putative transcriptional regulator
MKLSNVLRSSTASVIGALAVAAVGIFAGIVPAGVARAESGVICESQSRSATSNLMNVEAAGTILVANPELKDPQWQKTVLLATPLPSGAHIGVIINRPTQATLGKLFPDHEASKKVIDPVYYGGPFYLNVLVALIRSGDASEPGSLALTPDVVLSTRSETIDRIIEEQPASARYFAGMVIWRPGELRAELGEKLWSVCSASTETVFRKDMEQLWKELSATANGTRVSAPLPALALAR